jgi:NAD(P)-dependent dehydrogenase (short-subunit alcohol dehydrogenase family)
MPNKKLFDSGFSAWTTKQLPDLSGKLFVITGGNSGIGFEAARHLAKAGADLVLACRDKEKAYSAIRTLQMNYNSNATVVQLDLSNLSSVRAAAAELREKYAKIDGLLNNAGVMQTPQQRTKDDFEMQLGTNHLGHFLLTGLLIDLVEAAKGRVVTVSSIAHLPGVINFDDIMLDKGYTPSKAYSQSKLANLMFALELDRRLQAVGMSASSLACHPGYTSTNLVTAGPTGLLRLFYRIVTPFAQSGQEGAVPTVLCAAGTEAKSGGYYGPQLLCGLRGRVSDAVVSERAKDTRAQEHLWAISEALVKHKWHIGASANGGSKN